MIFQLLELFLLIHVTCSLRVKFIQSFHVVAVERTTTWKITQQLGKVFNENYGRGLKSTSPIACWRNNAPSSIHESARAQNSVEFAQLFTRTA